MRVELEVFEWIIVCTTLQYLTGVVGKDATYEQRDELVCVLTHITNDIMTQVDAQVEVRKGEN